MSSQLIGSGEALEASRIVALMGFFARVCSDMPCLVLEPVEGSITQRAFVGADGVEGLAAFVLFCRFDGFARLVLFGGSGLAIGGVGRCV